MQLDELLALLFITTAMCVSTCSRYIPACTKGFVLGLLFFIVSRVGTQYSS